MQKLVLIFFGLLFTVQSVKAQDMSIQQYIDTYKDLAIKEMKRMGVPASITLAQGILETENGNSDLVRKSNNHFGIKCKSSWSGGSVFHDDDERGECFRKYTTAEESYRDHSNFLRGSERYAFLFKLDPADYKGWAYGLKKAGYATNPKYPEILIKHIETYNLNQYSLEASGEVPVFDAANYQDDPSVAATTQTTTPSANGKTLFNGLKAIFVPAGTSLLAIATQFDISLAKLMEFNDLEKEGILPEETWIFLEKKLKQGKRDSYTTTGTETVYNIAQTNALQLSYLLEYNGLKKDDLVPTGTKIWLRDPSSIKTETEELNPKLHKVQPKEGLYSIAKKYNVSVEELREWNKLDSDNLRIGQQLIISK